MLPMLPSMPLDAPVPRLSQTPGSVFADESGEQSAGGFAEALGALLTVPESAAKPAALQGDEPDAVLSPALLPVDREGGKILPNGRELPLPGRPAVVQITDLAKANAAVNARSTPEDAGTATPPIVAGEDNVATRLAHERGQPTAGAQRKSARNPAEPAAPAAASLHSDPALAPPITPMIEAAAPPALLSEALRAGDAATPLTGTPPPPAAPGRADGHEAVSPRGVAAARPAPAGEQPMLSAPAPDGEQPMLSAATPPATPAPLAAAILPTAFVAPPPPTELAPDGAAPPLAAALALRKAKPVAAAGSSLAEPAAPVSPALATPSSAAAPAPVPASSPAMVSEAGAAHGASLGTLAGPSHASDLAATIDQLDAYREAARGIRPELTLRHSEFGTVNLRLEAAAGGGEWRALLTSRDPGFVPAVQAALADRAVAASSESAGHNSAHGGGRGGEGAASQGHSSGQSSYGSSPGSGQGSSQPYFAQISAGVRKPAAAEAGAEHRVAPPVGASRGGLYA